MILSDTVSLPSLPNGNYRINQGMYQNNQWITSAEATFTVSGNASSVQFTPWDTDSNGPAGSITFKAGNAPQAGVTVKLDGACDKSGNRVSALHLEGTNTSWPQLQLRIAGSDYTPKHVQFRTWHNGAYFDS